MSLIRLQRVLSQAGVASRRKAEEFILQGKVAVNGVTVRELGWKVDPSVDRISFSGKAISLQKQKVYYLLHKPRGVMVTKSDPEGRKTVFQLIPRLDSSVNSVGRLDLDSEGLLLLTNDGELAYRLTHPSFEVEKVYHVLLSELPSSVLIKKLQAGILLEGEKTSPARIEVLEQGERVWVRIKIHEGKKRQVRRMFEWTGVKVLRLVRVKMGPLELGNLSLGKWRVLSEKEVQNLKKEVDLR